MHFNSPFNPNSFIIILLYQSYIDPQHITYSLSSFIIFLPLILLLFSCWGKELLLIAYLFLFVALCQGKEWKVRDNQIINYLRYLHSSSIRQLLWWVIFELSKYLCTFDKVKCGIERIRLRYVKIGYIVSNLNHTLAHFILILLIKFGKNHAIVTTLVFKVSIII